MRGGGGGGGGGKGLESACAYQCLCVTYIYHIDWHYSLPVIALFLNKYSSFIHILRFRTLQNFFRACVSSLHWQDGDDPLSKFGGYWMTHNAQKYDTQGLGLVYGGRLPL